MSITQQAAIDVMYGIAKATIDAQAPGILGYAPDVRYVGQPKANRPDQTKVWIRVSNSIVLDDIAALANSDGQQLYEANGILLIEVFCPRNIAGSQDALGMPIAFALQSAYRSGAAAGEVWFIAPRITPMPETDESYPIRVLVKFQYRTVVDDAGVAVVGSDNTMTFLTAGLLRHSYTIVSNGPPLVIDVGVTVTGNGQLFVGGALQDAGVGNDYTFAGSEITFLGPVDLTHSNIAFYQ